LPKYHFSGVFAWFSGCLSTCFPYWFKNAVVFLNWV
jgi:hypothetical protein